MSSAFIPTAPAGLILTDIVAEYVFGSNEEYDYWLPEDNRIMHVKELVVDGDITGLGNITANGEMSAGEPDMSSGIERTRCDGAV